MDQLIKQQILIVDEQLQSMIDRMIELRGAAPKSERYLYSYVSKKIDAAGKSIGLALDKIEEIEGA